MRRQPPADWHLSQQRGQETLQAILAVSFVLLPVLFAIVEFGSLVHVWIGQSAAAAAGARVAGTRGEDDAIVRDRIDAELTAAGLNPRQVVVDVRPVFVHWGDPITVKLESHRRLAIPFIAAWDIPLISTSVGRGEVNH